MQYLPNNPEVEAEALKQEEAEFQLVLDAIKDGTLSQAEFDKAGEELATEFAEFDED